MEESLKYVYHGLDLDNKTIEYNLTLPIEIEKISGSIYSLLFNDRSGVFSVNLDDIRILSQRVLTFPSILPYFERWAKIYFPKSVESPEIENVFIFSDTSDSNKKTNFNNPYIYDYREEESMIKTYKNTNPNIREDELMEKYLKDKNNFLNDVKNQKEKGVLFLRDYYYSKIPSNIIELFDIISKTDPLYIIDLLKLADYFNIILLKFQLLRYIMYNISLRTGPELRNDGWISQDSKRPKPYKPFP
uniref:Uncharacterized protein n=1 Tax=Pithovirus LCPAC104 TaxID=2506589 RepID=A0A481Z4C9_9VIRU|nr:MAG: hypothetical protein LCPAC104_01240 [Pithovirus LCPAC104]